MLRPPGEQRGLSNPNLPGWRTVVTIAAITITAILMLEFGVWYFVALIAIYGVLDVGERLGLRRDARNHSAILATNGHPARSVGFIGSARHCQRAARVAKHMGWIACPMHRCGVLRHRMRLRHVRGAATLNALLEALLEAGLATRIRVPNSAEAPPSLARQLAERGYWDAGREI